MQDAAIIEGIRVKYIELLDDLDDAADDVGRPWKPKRWVVVESLPSHWQPVFRTARSEPV